MLRARNVGAEKFNPIEKKTEFDRVNREVGKRPILQLEPIEEANKHLVVRDEIRKKWRDKKGFVDYVPHYKSPGW